MLAPWWGIVAHWATCFISIPNVNLFLYQFIPQFIIVIATNNDLLMAELNESYFAQKLWLFVMKWLPRTTDNSTHFAQSLEIRGIESRPYKCTKENAAWLARSDYCRSYCRDLLPTLRIQLAWSIFSVWILDSVWRWCEWNSL